jgi:inhibitor of cysteine peptidase
VCTQALVPFEETIPLDVEGLLAGEYTVNVNGVMATFTLDVDNTPAS